MVRRLTYSVAVAGFAAGSVLIPGAMASAAACGLTATVGATPAIAAADLSWTVTATNCVDTPDVEIEVRDQATPSDPAGTVLSGLALSGNQNVSPLVGGHTYDVTLTVSADGEGAESATTVIPLAGPVVDRADQVTMHLSADDIPFGSGIELRGTAKTAVGDVTPDRKVTARFKAAGSPEWTKVGTGDTNLQGRYTIDVEPKVNGKLRVNVDNATADASAVEVDRKVMASFKDRKVRRGDKAVLTVDLKTAKPNTEVHLAVKTRQGWDNVDKKSSKDGDVTFKFSARKSASYRVSTSASDEFGAGSDTADLRVRRAHR